MDIETLREWIAQRDSYSILETIDVFSGERKVLKEFETVIEGCRQNSLIFSGFPAP